MNGHVGVGQIWEQKGGMEIQFKIIMRSVKKWVNGGNGIVMKV